MIDYDLHSDPLFVLKYECRSGVLIAFASSVVVPVNIGVATYVKHPSEQVVLSGNKLFGVEKTFVVDKPDWDNPVIKTLIKDSNIFIKWIKSYFDNLN